jgi:SAM-dependent methyltransferase
VDAPPFTLNAWLRYDLIERTLAGLDGIESILEIGAGRGALGARLATRYRYVGVEPDELSCEAAKEVLGRLGSGEMVCGDASALPEEAVFDAVCAFEVLEHIEDDAAALGEAWRVLASAGVLAVSVPRNPAWFSKSDEWAGHFRRYTRERLLEVVEAAGFEQLACVAWGFPMSALYHRTVYEVAVRRGAVTSGGGAARRGLPLLSALLAPDRLFVGWERGALGYVLVARRGP